MTSRGEKTKNLVIDINAIESILNNPGRHGIGGSDGVSTYRG